ncbi:MAG: MurR/RpiR family transcriptional regulator [Rubrivivax sp.]
MIDRSFEALSPELQRAARWLRQHQAALGLYSMRTSAKDAGVSPATMTRLAQRLGFDGFDSLREPFTRQLAGSSAPALASAAGRVGGDEPSAQLNLHQQSNVASAFALNSTAGLCEAADTLLHARNVCFLGMRVCHGVAFHANYVYGLLATNGTLIDDLGGTITDQITRLARDDVLVAISQSPYARHTVEGVLQAIERKATVIALTDSQLSPIARGAQHVLLYQTTMPSFFQSTTGAEALTELLLSTLAVRGGVRTQRRLLQMQEHLRRTRAYWDRPARASRAAVAAPDVDADGDVAMTQAEGAR